MADGESIEEIYDLFAASYDANRDRFDLSDVLRDFTAGLACGRSPGRLLDLGCGAGAPVARYFTDLGWQVTGVDLSRAMLRLAAGYVPEMTRIRADMRDVEFPDASFEAITLVYSLFHVPSADHPALFTKLRRWLTPGGRALMTYATRDYTGHDRFDGTVEFMGRHLFYSHVTPAELLDQLTDAGLGVVDSRDRCIGGETFRWVTVEAAANGVGD